MRVGVVVLAVAGMVVIHIVYASKWFAFDTARFPEYSNQTKLGHSAEV